MPFDMSPEVTIPADDVEPSLEGLLRWLETHDPETKYDYCESDTCLITRYMASLGLRQSSYESSWNYGGKSYEDSVFRPIARGNPLVPDHERWTYGAAADRCRALLAGRPT